MKNTELWVFIFIIGILGLNWPLLEIFHIEVVTYLFVFWILLIGLVAFASRKNGKWEANNKR